MSRLAAVARLTVHEPAGMVRLMPETASRLARLRAGTRDAHARMETVPALARLQDADLSRDEYVAVLQRMHGFHAVFEPIIAAAVASCPEAAAMLDGARPTALAEDLAWFGAASHSPPGPMPALPCVAAALGALYVVEGSGLGARIIARHLALSLGVTPGKGGSFYCGQSAEAARDRWHRLCAILDRPSLEVASLGGASFDDGPGEDRLVAGAVDTFRLLERWIRRIDTAPGHRQPRGAAAAA